MEVPRIRGPLMAVLLIRIMVYRVVSGSPLHGNYHILKHPGEYPNMKFHSDA